MNIFLAAALSAATGFFAVSLILPDKENFLGAAKLPLAVGFGLGLSSLIYFLLIYFFSGYRTAFLLVDLSVLAILAIAYHLLGRSKNKALPIDRTPKSSEKYPRSLVYAFLLLTALAVMFCLRRSWFLSEGDWDGWAIWKMHAKFLFLGGKNWQAAYALIPRWSHPDYPLLLPALVARFWQYASGLSLQAGVLTSLLFLLLIPSFLVLSLPPFSGKNNALLAGIFLLGTPFYVSLATAQYADTPLSLFLLVCIVFWCHSCCRPDKPAFIVISGIAAGLAAWTKSEGLLFCVALPLADILVSRVSKKMAPCGPRLLFYFFGLFPILAVVLLFKFTIGGQNTTFFFPGRNAPSFSWLDISRHLLILRHLAKEIILFGEWKGSLPAAMLLLFIFGKKRSLEPAEKQGVFISWAALLIILAGYEIVYSLTPLELEWQLKNSAGRLLMQLWPSVLFCFFFTIDCLPRKKSLENHR